VLVALPCRVESRSFPDDFRHVAATLLPELLYYMPDGESLVVSTPHVSEPIAESFSPSADEAAIREVQRGEIVYTELLQKTKAAGCVGYFVQIAGRRVLYFGRNGDIHVEPFPPAPHK
jgi:uncharacterized protein YbcV (DUF1398 family)